MDPDLLFIEKQKIKYKKMKPCYCKAIEERVHFTADGLSHLLYNRRRPRNIKERKYRAALIDFVEEVITDANMATKLIEPNLGDDSLWVIEHEVKRKFKGRRQIIKVILKKKGNAGCIHFLSVMCVS